jgi:uncharacterized membrane protein YraQ (UPF0718 family)
MIHLVLQNVFHSLWAAAGMFWNILWALILGFALSGVIMAFVPKSKMATLLGKPKPDEIALATFFGSVSSSCSYAAASMARSLFQKGAHIIPALAFMLASTNLVLELSLILWIMMGWQFVVAEFLGGILLVTIMSILMMLFAPLADFERKRKELNQSSEKEQDGHGAEHDDEDIVSDPKTLAGWRAASRAFVSEWNMIGRDLIIGVVISGFLMTLVPDSFWQVLFLRNGTSDESFNLLRLLENAFVGPLVSVLSFVCSVGNIPLANVLYHGGIGFGGALSFIYADLIIIPLILIYGKYYGWKLAAWITGLFYISMAVTGIIVDLLFHAFGLVPHSSEIMPVMDMKFFQINYTFWLNLIFLIIAGVLVWLAETGPQPEVEDHCCH